MPSLENIIQNKQVLSKQDILLLTELGFFSDLKRKNIGFNIHPFKNPDHIKVPKIPKQNLVDLHLEIAKKIDELTIRNERESKNNNIQHVTKLRRATLPEIIEIRQPLIRKIEIPRVRTELAPKNALGNLNYLEEFFEIEQPPQFVERMQTDEDFPSWMADEKIQEKQKTFMGFSRIRVSTDRKGNEKNTSAKINDLTITKIELERAKKEIEEKQKELEEIKRKEKEKQIELKLEEEEKRKQEKQRKIELKKKLKEEKIKAKLAKKAELKKQKELKKLGETKNKEIQDKKEIDEKIDTLEHRRTLTEDDLVWDEDVAKLLPIIDSLFENLPEDIIEDFANSESYKLYEKVLSKYKSK